LGLFGEPLVFSLARPGRSDAPQRTEPLHGLATIASRTSGPYTSGRPLRGLPDSAGMPPRAKRCRQVRTVVTEQPSSGAICTFGQR
jgi:hypothetical protein